MKNNIKKVYDSAPPLWDWRRGDPPDSQKDTQEGSSLLSRCCFKCHQEIGFGLFAHEMQCDGLPANEVREG